MEVRKLLEKFEKNSPDQWPFAGLIAAAKADARFPEKFARKALERRSPDGVYFHMLLGRVSEPGFARLIEIALETIEAGDSDSNAASLIAYASLQFPQLLHPHLEQIFRLRVNEHSDCANFPWRGSWSHSREHLTVTVTKSRSKSARRKAWDCLLECRTPDALKLAIAQSPKMALESPLAERLKQVGFTRKLAPLCREDCRHIVFKANYFKDRPPPWKSRDFHPTWRLNAAGPSLRFGGKARGHCGLCRRPLSHLIRHPDLEIPLVTCTTCLGWESGLLSFRHDSRGEPVALDRGRVRPKYPAKPLVETTVRLAPTPPRWFWQDWALANDRENLFRIGGFPSWIQDADYPKCPDCRKFMAFEMQLDSNLPSGDRQAMTWGSGGICYVFWCGDCRVSSMKIQDT